MGGGAGQRQGWPCVGGGPLGQLRLCSLGAEAGLRPAQTWRPLAATQVHTRQWALTLGRAVELDVEVRDVVLYQLHLVVRHHCAARRGSGGEASALCSEGREPGTPHAPALLLLEEPTATSGRLTELREVHLPPLGRAGHCCAPPAASNWAMPHRCLAVLLLGDWTKGEALQVVGLGEQRFLVRPGQQPAAADKRGR